MTSRLRHPTRRRRTGALALCALALLLASPLVAAPSARAAPDPETTSIELAGQNIWIDPNGAILSRVRVMGAPEGAQIQAILHTRLRDRRDLVDSYRGEDLGGYQLWQPPVPLTAFPPLADGALDATLALGLSDGTTEARGRAVIREPGVFPVEIRVLDADDTVLASLVSYAVRLPAATQAATVKPLAVAPVLGVGTGGRTSAEGSTTVDPETRTAVAGVVAALTSRPAGAVPPPVALAANPQLLRSLATSTTRGDPILASDLAGALGDRTVLQQTSVPLDLATWLANPTLAPHLEGFLARGNDTLRSMLHRVDDPATWVDLPAPSRTPLSAAALDWLAAHGIRRLVLPDADLQPLDTSTSPATLTRPFTLDTATTDVTAVQIDAQLQDDFSARGTLGATRVLADLALLALDDPSTARGIVLAPPTASLDPLSLRTVLDSLQTPTAGPTSAPLLRTVSLTALFQLPPATTGRAPGTDGTPLVRELRTAEPDDASGDLGDYPTQFDVVATRLADLARMVGDDDTQVQKVRSLLDASGERGLALPRRKELVDAAEHDIVATTSKVTLPPRQTVTLTARSAVIPVTIRSSLSTPATVTIHLDSSERLEFVDGSEQTIKLTGETTHIRLRVRTRTPGDATLRLRLTSPDGTLLIAESRYTVHATAVSGVGLVISIGALTFLVLWWVRHGLRTRRERRARHIRPAALFDLPDEAPTSEGSGRSPSV